jgi:2-(1,2-epoxy-1,2-dihydrophenyl)acetyl-CoA isomerase
MADTLIERRDGVVTVTFNRPHKRNALSAANWADLEQVTREVARNPADRALVLTGSGGAFSAGADLTGDVGDGSGFTGIEMQGPLHEMRTANELVNRLQRLPKPTVALVDGVAAGVAAGLALACDFVIASDRAEFGIVFVKRGLALDGGTSWLLPRLVGARRAKEMAFLGEMVPAQQALEWGLVNDVVPADEIGKVGEELARRLASGPTTALSLIKRQLDDGMQLTFEEALEGEARAQHIAFTTDDMGEGILAFLERREPRFTGK